MPTPLRRPAAAVALVLTGLSLAGCGSSIQQASLSDRECMARVMYFESNRSSDDGMLAVGTVVMNRVQSPKYPKSVCGVVGQTNQFAEGALSKPVHEGKSYHRALRVADAVLDDGKRHPGVGSAMFFHTAGYSFPYRNMRYVTLAGGNIFYEKQNPTPGSRWPSSTMFARAHASGRATMLASAEPAWSPREPSPAVVATRAPAPAPRPVQLASADDEADYDLPPEPATVREAPRPRPAPETRQPEARPIVLASAMADAPAPVRPASLHAPAGKPAAPAAARPVTAAVDRSPVPAVGKPVALAGLNPALAPKAAAASAKPTGLASPHGKVAWVAKETPVKETSAKEASAKQTPAKGQLGKPAVAPTPAKLASAGAEPRPTDKAKPVMLAQAAGAKKSSTPPPAVTAPPARPKRVMVALLADKADKKARPAPKSPRKLVDDDD